MNWLRRWSVPAFVVVFSFTAFAACEPPSQGLYGGPPPHEGEWHLDRSLTLAPQSEPQPALRYQLFPLASERKDGNAVPIYLAP